MQVILKINPKYKHRLQIRIPVRASFWIEEIEQLKHIYFHSKGHYSMIYHQWAIGQLRKLYNESLTISFDETKYSPITFEKKKGLKKAIKKPKYMAAVDALEKWIQLKQYSYHTLKSYKACFINFLLYFDDKRPSTITKAEIENYLHHLIKEKNISISAQNQIINAIKCFYEKVLKRPRELYNIERPKKAQTLPQVFSMYEVKRLLEAVPNLKHRTILIAIYSGGLRLGEVLRLRVQDVMLAQQKIFIKAGKNKKDRYTLLSQQFISILELYHKSYRPQYWLFEGQDGGQYSASSVQQIFRRAAQKAQVGDFATLHTLRHSFATHLLEQGIDIRYIQELLGHSSIETTVIYTHVAQNKLKDIISPIDNIDLKSMYPQ